MDNQKIVLLLDPEPGSRNAGEYRQFLTDVRSGWTASMPFRILRPPVQDDPKQLRRYLRDLEERFASVP